MAGDIRQDKDKLEKIKRSVKEAYEYFSPNIERYHMARDFLFRSNLTEEEKDNLEEIGKAALQFNVLESYVSRLRGDFAKQEPAFIVHPSPDVVTPDLNAVKVVEGHLVAILQESKKKSMENTIYTDQMSGGFSAMKVWTEFESERSFNQKICMGRVYDPTLTYFDPMAREPHKGDGKFAGELFPMTIDDFEDKYPDEAVDAAKMPFGDWAGFKWSYMSGGKKILLICDHYEKVTKRKKLMYLANGRAVYTAEYKQILAAYEESKTLMQPPAVIRTRVTEVETICRYRLIGSQILEYEETIFKALPIIFVDGNSCYLKDSGKDSISRQFTRPYIFQAMDAQKLKNVAGQAICCEIEGMIASKFMAPVESIPEQYVDAWINPQKASTLMFNAFMKDGATPLPPPIPVQRQPLPPEVTATFVGCDQTIQSILGAFDAQRASADNDLSGVAIANAQNISNNASMPYIVNFLASLGQAAQIAVDIMPETYMNARMISMVNDQRKKQSIPINGFGGQRTVNLNYEPASLRVSVEAGVNFDIQKNESLKMMGMLSQAFPAFAQLINTKGLPILLDNLDIRGGDQLKELAQQQMQMQAKQPQQPNPEMLKLQLDQQKLMMDNQHKQADIQIDQQQLQNDQTKMLLDFYADQQDHQVQLAKSDTERTVNAADLAMKAHDQDHQHKKDVMDHVENVMHSVEKIAHEQNKPTPASANDQ